MGSTSTKHTIKLTPKADGAVKEKQSGPLDANRKELLSKYCEQTNKSAQVAALTRLAISVECIALKYENIEELLSPEATAAAKTVISDYLTVKPLKSGRHLLSSLAVDLELPKLTFNVARLMKQKFSELTRWDRDKKEKEPESAETKNNEGNNLKIIELEVEESEENLKRAQVLVSDLLCCCLNFSDSNDEYCLSCGQVGIIPLCVQMVEELKDCIPDMIPFVDKTLQVVKKFTVRGKMLSRILGVLHNLVKRMPNRILFAECHAIDVLVPFMKAEVTLYATKGLFCLAYLADESNNHLIMADAEPIMYIVQRLTMAVNSKQRKYLGYRATELVDGLTQIGINDQNKKKIGECGAIPVLVSMIETAKDEDESLLAAKCLWILAFDENNQHLMRSNEICMAALYKLKTSNNQEIKTAASGTLWEIEGKSKHTVGKGTTADSITNGRESPEVSKHVMISYQWDVQSTMVQVKNKLQEAGYKVWMDLDQMGGSTLEAMAKAVEDSAVVLVCVSQKYKESPNCRSEAEYAFSLHKDIIPLMMEKHYRPDGWLGIIVGSKFWFEFVERHMIENSLEKLTKELGVRGMMGESTDNDANKGENKAEAADIHKPDIQHWTNEEVTKWLKDIGLKSVSNKSREWLDGKMLIRLHHLRRESPEFFYNSIKSDLELKSLCQVVTFVDELEKLAG